MTEEPTSARMPTERLAMKLRDFYDGLAADEQPILASILGQTAASPSVEPSDAHKPADAAVAPPSRNDFRARLP